MIDSTTSRICSQCNQKMYNYGYLIDNKILCNRCMQRMYRIEFDDWDIKLKGDKQDEPKQD